MFIKDNVNILLGSFCTPFSYLPPFTFNTTLLTILTRSFILATPAKSSFFSLLTSNITNLCAYSYTTLRPLAIIIILDSRP